MNPSTSTAHAARYDLDPPQEQAPGVRSWITRGANFVLVLSEVQAGARLARDDQPDEYMLLLPDAPATVTANGERLAAGAGSLTIVPPGASEVVAQAAGRVVRLFSSRCADLLPRAGNAAHYSGDTQPGVAPLQPWPAPPDGWRLRHYVLADHVRPGQKTRVFRSSHLMINVLLPREQPRDVRELSPHAHADFEQGSLALAGRWVHHLRTPWTADMSAWREDEHLEIGSPSLLVIPPKLVHTSRNVNAGPAWLVDVFAPPRLDFERQGLVLNADDYPLPATA